MTTPRLQVAARTGWLERSGTVYAAALPDGPPLVLAGAGAVIWRAVVRGGTLADVTRRVADDTGSPLEVVTADVTTFVDGLVDAGLVVRGDATDDPATARG